MLGLVVQTMIQFLIYTVSSLNNELRQTNTQAAFLHRLTILPCLDNRL